MGVLAAPGKVKLDAVENQTGLGTPPPDARIAATPGAAATATFTPDGGGKLEAFVTIVTTMDGTDLLSLAKARLVDAEAGGFDGVAWENTKWWNRFYDQRETGRIFHGTAGSDCTDDIRAIYRSYADNEIFTTSRFVRNWGDSEDLWKEVVWHWKPAAEENARDEFSLPGICNVHGYLPPVRPDKYVHTTITLEFCLGTFARSLARSGRRGIADTDLENARRSRIYQPTRPGAAPPSGRPFWRAGDVSGALGR